ncbi:hypothetical protein HCN44_001261 [Aphidius gifuensis]|uniref:Uncharacterized protein n=1 Tax=Aphidius gifuensis TaxID=684658 RepID=A0A834XLV6_APHGI|nr:hypothetical protein HCN44_001261 [Aphidius gifuensis]
MDLQQPLNELIIQSGQVVNNTKLHNSDKINYQKLFHLRSQISNDLDDINEFISTAEKFQKRLEERRPLRHFEEEYFQNLYRTISDKYPVLQTDQLDNASLIQNGLDHDPEVKRQLEIKLVTPQNEVKEYSRTYDDIQTVTAACLNSSITKICTPVGILRHIKQRLSDEKELSEGAEKILDEYIAEEDKYNAAIVRSEKGWKRLPDLSPQEMEMLDLANKKTIEYTRYCKELGPSPTLDQMKKKNELNDELKQLTNQLFPQE